MNNIKTKFALFILLLAALFNLRAQEPVMVSGKVIDAKTDETIPLVNIGIEGTLVGTASKADGTFSFKVPAENSADKLYFSAIGYQNLVLPLQEFLNNNGPVQLQPLSYGIDDIEISTRSKVLYRIVRDAAAKIPGTFVHRPYSCQMVYQNEEYANQVLVKKRDAMVLLSDETGYTTTDNAAKAINYKFLNVQRNFDVNSLADGTTLMDELLSFDVARTSENVMDTDFLNDYDLDLVGESTMGNDSVWIIGYRLAQPNLSHTGDIHPESSEGQLYITKQNTILLKVEAQVTLRNQSRNGRSVMVPKQKGITGVRYRYITTYKYSPEGYVLDRVALNKSFVNEKNEPSKLMASLLVLDINTTNPQMVEKRQYFENMLSDPDFWSGK